jgi:hypothetical protein
MQFLGLLLVMWANHLFYLGALELHVFALSVICYVLCYRVLFGLLAVALLNVLAGEGVCCVVVSHHGRSWFHTTNKCDKKREHLSYVPS